MKVHTQNPSVPGQGRRRQRNRKTRKTERSQQKRIQKAEASWTTSQKVALFGLGAVVVCGAAYLIYQTMSNGNISHFEGVDIKQLDRPIVQFPEQFYRMPYNGHMSSFDGRSLCLIDQDYPNPKYCDRFGLFIEQLLKIQHPHLYNAPISDLPQPVGHILSLDQFDTPVVRSSLGVLAGDRLGISRISVHQNPNLVQNFKNSLRMIENVVLKNPQEFFSKNPSEILKTVLDSHRRLFDRLPNLAFLPGEYRSEYSFVAPANSQTVEEYLNLAIERGALKDSPKLLDIVLEKLKQGPDKFIQEIDASERRFFEKYFGTINPYPQEIPELMNGLAVTLKKVGNGILERSIDPIKAASTIHCQIGKIHPFGDGNGRVARLWMNTLLQLGGYRAVIFPEDDAYTEAITKELGGASGAFASFLEKIIIWNRQQGH